MPINAVIGYQGSGKTYFMVRQMYATAKKHPSLQIVCNIPGIFVPFGDQPILYVEDIEDCFDLHDCMLCLDEIHLWFGARDYQKHKGRYVEWVSQLRKRRVDLWYTAQAIRTVDSVLRDMTHYTYKCNSLVKIGIFLAKSYEGITEPKNIGLPRLYLFNPYIAACYPRYALVGTQIQSAEPENPSTRSPVATP